MGIRNSTISLFQFRSSIIKISLYSFKIMIQRIQSLLLLLTAVALSVCLASNFFVKVLSSDELIAINSFHAFHKKGNTLVGESATFYIAVVIGISIALSIFTIFQYKKRLLQMILNSVNSLLMTITAGLIVYHVKIGYLKTMGADDAEPSVGMYAFLVAIFTTWLANRFIKRDEKMVKDADSRLR
ncbi:MAG: DUF4293 domain-containing protein [Leadbetterella sp.]